MNKAMGIMYLAVEVHSNLLRHTYFSYMCAFARACLIALVCAGLSKLASLRLLVVRAVQVPPQPKKNVTMFFSDIVSFTTISASLPHEKVCIGHDWKSRACVCTRNANCPGFLLAGTAGTPFRTVDLCARTRHGSHVKMHLSPRHARSRVHTRVLPR